MNYIVNSQYNMNNGLNECPYKGANLEQVRFYEKLYYPSFEAYYKRTNENFLLQGENHRELGDSISRILWFNHWILDIKDLHAFGKEQNFEFYNDTRYPYCTLIIKQKGQIL
jgi:hypothetical protein